MPFYISDIFPYLSKDCKKQLEIQLGIILRDSSKTANLKCYIIQKIKNTYVDKLKKILMSPQHHVVKKMFLEGGFIEKTEIHYPTFDFPVIELNDYYYLPLELYEAILKEDFFKKNHYIFGILNTLPEKEIKYWKIWLENETNVAFEPSKNLSKNRIFFYFYLLLSPLSIRIIHQFSKDQFSIKECFPTLIDQYPLNLFNECFSFYQALQKLYYERGDSTIIFDNQKMKLKDLLLYFLSGKLMPIFKNQALESIVQTKELRDIEISQDNDSKSKVFDLNLKK
jgi:hypothetical protein